MCRSDICINRVQNAKDVNIESKCDGTCASEHSTNSNQTPMRMGDVTFWIGKEVAPHARRMIVLAHMKTERTKLGYQSRHSQK
jgi:hypothetical protein